jgi:hypothetical protein
MQGCFWGTVPTLLPVAPSSSRVSSDSRKFSSLAKGSAWHLAGGQRSHTELHGYNRTLRRQLVSKGKLATMQAGKAWNESTNVSQLP